MGIDGFGSFLRKECPTVFKAAARASFSGTRVAIDMHLMVYQMFFRNGGDSGNALTDAKRFAARLRRDKISAVFVFDGITVGLKPRAHKNRKDAHNKSKSELKLLQDQTTAISTSLAKAYEALTEGFEDIDVPLAVDAGTEPVLVAEAFIDVVTNAQTTVSVLVADAALDEPLSGAEKINGGAGEAAVTDIGELLQMRRVVEARAAMVSIRVMQPPGTLFRDIKAFLKEEFGEDAVVVAEDDGERHVAALCAAGSVDFAVSSDYDTLAFGSPNIVIDFSNPEKTMIIELAEVLRGLKLDNLAQFQDFCILCGCDFCEKVPGIGPVTALRSLQKYKCIEEMLQPVLSARIKKQQETSSFVFDYKFARSRYAGLPVGC